jgi:hypothetical protein
VLGDGFQSENWVLLFNLRTDVRLSMRKLYLIFIVEIKMFFLNSLSCNAIVETQPTAYRTCLNASLESGEILSTESGENFYEDEDTDGDLAELEEPGDNFEMEESIGESAEENVAERVEYDLDSTFGN